MTARAVLAAARPAHAWKSTPVLAGLLFGGRWDDASAVASTLACAVAFTAVAAAGYLVNDVLDRDADRAHPRRRLRPVARGALAVRTALAAAGGLLVGGLALAAVATPPAAAGLVGAYAATTLLYSWRGKRVAPVAVAMVAGGFVLRVAAGAAAAGVAPSPWLLPLTAVLALGLATAKREAEARRAALPSARWLARCTDALLLAAAAGYVAWTLAPGTVALHRTRWLLATGVPVVLALARFRARLRRDATGLGPAELVAGDPVLLALGAAWAAACAVVLAFAR